MIKKITVRNFQSLKHVEMDLDKFTVIVGPSSVGKSAFTRSLKLLTENKRGDDFITYGERVATVSAETDKGRVVISRGKGKDDNSYTTVDLDGDQKKYTKLNGATPIEVSQFLGIKAKDPLNYASQFDKPYLLDEGASDVARVLGELTNVSVIFNGAREANRQKGNTSTILKSKSEDLQTIMNKMDVYRALKAQIAAIDEAETALERARTLSQRIAQLERASETYKLAVDTQEQLAPLLEIVVPDEKPVLEAHKRVYRFDSLVNEIKSAAGAAKTAAIELEEATMAESSLNLKYTEVLRLAGTCPTCGQGTTHLEHEETN
jgi:DNA repair ATPase RecN